MDWLSNEYTGQFLQLLSFATEEVGMDFYTIIIPWQSISIKPLVHLATPMGGLFMQ